MLFNDDLLAAGTLIKRTHFVELQQAVNEMRAAASLPPFEFEAGFATAPVLASHLTGLQTALNQARSTLGMSTATFTPIVAGTTVIRASDVQQLRDLSR
jgi:hypothetical protein